MKGFNFLENAKKEENLEKKMFPQLFELSNEELLTLKGGNVDCDAVCLPSEWGGTCSCHDNVAVALQLR
ncbi:MAG: hypothetical protein JXR57_13525 [Bacteroidales bacterium]|nr:hypothetical protein [Bacteroidales bacterium]